MRVVAQISEVNWDAIEKVLSKHERAISKRAILFELEPEFKKKDLKITRILSAHASKLKRFKGERNATFRLARGKNGI